MSKKQIGDVNFKNYKGFTLIELLAVIVILAVIALILTPIVSGIIKTAKKNAFESTGYGILESTKLYYSKQVGDLSSDLTFTCNNDTCTSGEEKLEFKGNINGSGTILLFKDGNIALCLESSDYATLKNVGDERLSTTENGTCEFDEETKEYSVNASVSAKLYEELQDQYNSLVQDYNNGKEVISNAITDKGIDTSGALSFDDMASNIAAIDTGNPNLRYDETTGYIQAKNVDGIWIDVYKTDILPVSATYVDLIPSMSSNTSQNYGTITYSTNFHPQYGQSYYNSEVNSTRNYYMPTQFSFLSEVNSNTSWTTMNSGWSIGTSNPPQWWQFTFDQPRFLNRVKFQLIGQNTLINSVSIQYRISGESDWVTVGTYSGGNGGNKWLITKEEIINKPQVDAIRIYIESGTVGIYNNGSWLMRAIRAYGLM